ncbi:M20 family metallopeptidase [Ensifer aridi]|uniref:M20 family metallopeptidase n=1 Tax=Ensifer aridi TaxID=1708715 RepID=UPI001FCD70D9|nr:M20 family metallopeptidase [Ensifer aridi]
MIEAVCAHVDAKKDKFIALADHIWDLAEIRFQEHESSKAQMQALEEEGFRIERNIAALPTAFTAEYGAGSPVIAILGEYDALAGLSQVAGATEMQPIDPSKEGHGCGHHLLGTAGVMAAVAVKDYLRANNGSGTIRYYGCPAEEGGSGKTFMARAGAFDDVDTALCWHPSPFNAVNVSDTLANLQAYFHFAGKASHAAVSPHLGRSALDAVELMNVGVNYMREHMPQTARVHYAITSTGGISPNVVQAEASVLYLVRSLDIGAVWAIFERVKKIAEGAALMTETTVECEIDRATSAMLPNTVLDRALQRNLEAAGGPDFDASDFDFGERIRETLSEEEIADSFVQLGLDVDLSKVMHTGVVPLGNQRQLDLGSTDVADVSRVVPTAQFWGACYAVGTPFHSWQMVAQGKLPAAHKGMTYAAKVLAATALDLLNERSLVEAAKTEYRSRMDGNPYECPIPDDVLPKVLRKAKRT